MASKELIREAIMVGDSSIAFHSTSNTPDIFRETLDIGAGLHRVGADTREEVLRAGVGGG